MDRIAETVCCICQSFLDGPKNVENAQVLEYKSDRRTIHSRASFFPCCSRQVCGECQEINPRFRFYCPFCQVYKDLSLQETTGLGSDLKQIPGDIYHIQTLPQGLRLPPTYSADVEPGHRRSTSRQDRRTVGTETTDVPPAYDYINRNAEIQQFVTRNAPTIKHPQDAVHFLNQEDTAISLAIAYSIPVKVLLEYNKLNDARLLHARHSIIIPGRYNTSGATLSASPTQDPEELKRKARQRRFMMRTKCADYDLAVLYLEFARQKMLNHESGSTANNEQDLWLETAVKQYNEDEAWEHRVRRKNGSAQRSGKKGHGA